MVGGERERGGEAGERDSTVIYSSRIRSTRQADKKGEETEE